MMRFLACLLLGTLVGVVAYTLTGSMLAAVFAGFLVGFFL